jgi:thiol-disulfide isomerase/thioredoxin
MVRIWAVALLALLAVTFAAAATGDKDKDKGTDKEFKVDGKLTADDPKDKRTGTASKVHTQQLKAGQIYAIRMVSDEVDAFLRLEDASGKELALNDDEGPGTFNAKIVFKCKKDADYKIIATCFPQPAPPLKLEGKYTLTVGTATKEEIVAAFPHDHMIGKAAPDFTGDFCLNGKTTKLSDLKGKVVLVDFWAVWCGPCIATFPHLRDWTKQYGKDGLVILGATTYYQRLGFDKDKGQITQLKEELNAADERDMVKDFAAHHKLTHELLMLDKQEYGKASKAYAVSGIPTAVLIDRQGNVQMVRVGASEENAEALHDKIRELLKEK